MTTDKQQRKERPIARGVLDYFPDAIAEVAYVSCVGGRQHNVNGELKWEKHKSPDHADCIARHLLERGTLDTDGLRHSAKVAWRALAMLQIEIEDEAKSPLARSCQDVCAPYRSFAPTPKVADGGTILLGKVEPQKFLDRPERERDFNELIRLGCPDQVAEQIVMGTTYGQPAKINDTRPYVYLAGPMRGLPQFNFPAFDQARDELVKRGFNVISPADIDRAAEFDPPINARQHGADHGDQRDYCFRDFWALYFIAQINQKTSAIVMLRNYERSVGATAEYGIAKWLGLNLREFDRDFPPRSEESDDREYIWQGMVYRLSGSSLLCAYPGHNFTRSVYGVDQFREFIARGEAKPCEPSSSATSTNPSATPATSASAKTCATPTNVRT